MTAKEIRQSLIDQCKGNKRMAMDLYKQIQRSLANEKKPLNSIWWLKIIRNDYIEEPNCINPVIHFEYNNTWCETCLSLEYEG